MDQRHGQEHAGEELPTEQLPDPSSNLLPPEPIPAVAEPELTFPDDPNSSLDPDIQPVTPPALNPQVVPPVKQLPRTAGTRNPPPPPPPPPDEEEEDEDGMLRMSFMDHLEELRSRLIRILGGAAIALVTCMVFASPIWDFVDAPLRYALSQTGGKEVALSLTEAFSIKWMWMPFVASIYLSSPWIIYQIWAFIAPGLYPRERRWAGPFIIVTAGLFVGGGVFAYYVAFRYALVFLLGLGGPNIENNISIDSYFTTFVTVMLGSSLLFLMPVAVFFTTLLRITTPAFLMRNARYAILGIVTLAAVVTPTPDPINLAMLAVPLILLFFLGVFASYLLVLNREGQQFPWKAFLIWVISILVLIGIVIAFLVGRYHYQIVPEWPFLLKPNIV